MNQQDIDNLLEARKTLSGYIESNLASLDGIGEAITTILKIEAESPNLVQDPSLLDDPKLVDMVAEIREGTLEQEPSETPVDEHAEAQANAIKEYQERAKKFTENIHLAVKEIIASDPDGPNAEMTPEKVADIAANFAWSMGLFLSQGLTQILEMIAISLTKHESDSIEVEVVVDKLFPTILAGMTSSAVDFRPMVTSKEEMEAAANKTPEEAGV
jgi:hypothetical protein